MKQRMALYLQDAHDLRDGLDYVRYAEEKGFEAVWQAESRWCVMQSYQWQHMRL